MPCLLVCSLNRQRAGTTLEREDTQPQQSKSRLKSVPTSRLWSYWVLGEGRRSIHTLQGGWNDGDWRNPQRQQSISLNVAKTDQPPTHDKSPTGEYEYMIRLHVPTHLWEYCSVHATISSPACLA